jgi:hypothetical protein
VIDPGTKQMWINSFRHGVRVGLSQVRRIPGSAKTVTQPIGRVLLEVLRDRDPRRPARSRLDATRPGNGLIPTTNDPRPKAITHRDHVTPKCAGDECLRSNPN